MITKIAQLKSVTQIEEVKTLCESALNAISSSLYNKVSSVAQIEIQEIALNNLFDGLAKYPKDKFVTEWLTNQKRVYSVKNLGVRKAVNVLIENEAKYDDTLAIILDDFREKLDDTPEVLLYEAFISAMSGFNHLPAVYTELSAVANRVSQYKNDIDISKIIEIMKETRSNYLIPLIEDVVDNYLSNKNEQTKHILKETLVKFSYDSFIKDILNLVTLDATELQLEYANTECDIIDKLFSPIIYLGENEALFNIKGTYYVKKNNYINKLKHEDAEKFDENFKALCEVINFPNVEVTRKDITVYVGNDNAVLNEDGVIINGIQVDMNKLDEGVLTSHIAGNTNLLSIVHILHENFNEIAELDFVKRVYLKENENYAADVFKLRDNIFITTFDPINNKSTFYRNINPIQAEKIMMEHMRFDVSKTFAEILPNKEKILLEINSTKKEYSDYIQILETKIVQFSKESGSVVKEVIKALNEELSEIKNDYKNYLNEIEKFLNVNENLNITVQDDQSGKSYTVVVPTGAMAAKGENGIDSGAEGDEFGTEVGMSSMTAPGADGASSAVTFDDDQSELISDEPSMDQDKVELGADDLEAYADKVDAETELEAPEGEEEVGVEGGAPGEEPAEGGEGLDLGDSGEVDSTGDTSTELDLGLDQPEGEPEGDEGNIEKPKKEEEGAEPPATNLERTNFNKDKNPNDISEVPKKIKKVFLKRAKTAPVTKK